MNLRRLLNIKAYLYKNSWATVLQGEECFVVDAVQFINYSLEYTYT